MTVWMIEGVVEEVTPKRTRGDHTYYERVRLRERSGAEQTLTKLQAAGDVAKALQPGASGRFYLTKSVDQTGFHGVRLDDGTAAYRYFVNVKLIWILLGLNVLIFAGGLAFGKIYGLCLIVGVLLSVGMVFYMRAKGEGRRQYDADAPTGTLAAPATAS